jgi:CheY-like chemotaxis protein
MDSIRPKTGAPAGTVLVVDDTEDNLVIATLVLEEAGIRCLSASRGWQCIEIAKRQPIDLILLDLIMPRMDGWMTLAELRRDPVTAHLPVIMFTCDDRLITRERAMREGVVDFLPRPVAPEKLLACVRTHLQAVENSRALDAVDRGLESTLFRLQKNS